MTMKPARCQFSVYQIRFGAKVLLGGGVRIGDYLVAPTHVIYKDNLVLMVGNEILYDSVDKSLWIELAPDMSGLLLSPQARAKIPAATVAPFSGTPYVRVQATCQSQNTSYGMLKAAETFGQAIYTGSTRAGFSGAAYVDVDRVYAIHQGGGAINYAMSAAFIKMRLQRLVKPEDSELMAIRNAFRRLKNKEDWAFETSGSPGEYELRVGGSYFLIDEESMDELYTDDYLADWFDIEVEGKKTRRKPNKRSKFIDDEPESFGLEDALRKIYKKLTSAIQLGTEEAIEAKPQPDDLEQMIVALNMAADKLFRYIQDEVVGAAETSTKNFQLVLDTVCAGNKQLSSQLASGLDQLSKRVDTLEENLLQEPMPEIVPEVADDDMEPAFLGEQPQSCLNCAALATRIDAQDQTIASIQTMLEFQTQEITTGHQRMNEQLNVLSSSILSTVQQQTQHLLNQQQEKLQKSFDERCGQTISVLDALSTKVDQCLTLCSRASLEPLNPPAPRGLVNSENTPRSVTPSDGMELALAKYAEWRTLNKPSLENFEAMRTQYLESLGLSTTEQAKLIRNYSNSQQRRRWKGNKKSRTT